MASYSAKTAINGMILAAGHGSRMGEISQHTPKPMLPMCNRPLCHWALQLMHDAHLGELAANLHHLGSSIERSLSDQASLLGRSISFSREETLLGTGGGIRAMSALLPRRTTVTVNGKIVTDADLQEAIQFHRENGSEATMVLYPVEDPDAWGAIGLDMSHRIVSLPGPPSTTAPTTQHFMYTGIQILEPERIDALPAGSSCLIRDGYRRWLQADARIFGYVHRGYFYEHSTPARYLMGNMNLVRGHASIATAPTHRSGIHPSARLAQDATITTPVLIGEGVEIAEGTQIGPDVIIGANCRIDRGVRLSHSVVWPQTAVEQSAQHSIITPHGKHVVTELANSHL